MKEIEFEKNLFWMALIFVKKRGTKSSTNKNQVVKKLDNWENWKEF